MYPLDPVVGMIVCSSLALLFAVASAHKLRALSEFAETLSGYRVLPAMLVRPASRLVPVLEGLVAAGLLIRPARESASLAGAVLLAIYAVAMALNLLRGRRQLDCGCLGPGGGGVVSVALVWRNVLMALTLAAAGGTRWSSRRMDWLDLGTALAAACAMALLYVAANGLLASAAHPRLRRE